jgi:hypothetical protein
MAVVKCLMMQRDEDLLLEPWLRYNGYLFGFENLYVFDNGSTKPGVIKTLDRYEQTGVRVLRHLSTPQHYLTRGHHFAAFIQHLDETETHDLVMLLDCDEFLALFTESGLTCERTAIHRYLDRLVGSRDVLGLYTTTFNVPGKPGWFWPQRGSKRFFSRDTIGVLDRGFHTAMSRKSDRIFDTDLTHLHYHHKPHRTVVEQAKRKLRAFVDVTDRQALARHTGSGAHLTRHLLMSEQEYLTQFVDKLLIRFDGLSRALTALGIKSALLNPPGSLGQVGDGADGLIVSAPTTRAPGEIGQTIFNGALYRAANPDIAFLKGSAAAHFVTFGYQEGRPLRPAHRAAAGAWP